MEAMNDALKLIAKALEMLRDRHNLTNEIFEDSIHLLEQAVDKLAV